MVIFFRGPGAGAARSGSGTVAGSLRIENRVSARLVDRRDVEPGANLTDSARATRSHVELLHLGPGVAENREDNCPPRGRPRWRQCATTCRDRARLGAIAVDDLELAVVDVRNARLGDSAFPENPLLDLIRHPVQREPPIPVPPVE